MKNRVSDDVPDHVKEKWDERVKFCLENSQHMTDWENDFVASIEEQRSYDRELTPKQVKVLYSIYHKVEWKVG